MAGVKIEAVERAIHFLHAYNDTLAQFGTPITAAELRGAAGRMPTTDWEWVTGLLTMAADEIDRLKAQQTISQQQNV